MTGVRLADGGDIDRDRPLSFSFEGRAYEGFAGDTLASALLANGVRVVGRSFKYHRPRGLLAAGVEEPNGLMRIGDGARTTVSPRATEIALHDGLAARAVNCWPGVDFDLGAVNGLVSRFIPAGFYYKTLMWPNWRLFEPFIRRAAGLSRPSPEPDPDRYDSRFAHCDILVVGAGPAGLAAALAASRGGARVILCEQDDRIGGRVRWDPAKIDGETGRAWAEAAATALRSLPETTLLTRTTAVGYFDHNALVLLQQMSAGPGRPVQRLWQVRAGRVILATGAIERPLVFPGNDRPGVMLASAVRRYVGRWAVRPGRRAVIFTNNNDAYATVRALTEAGGHVAAIVDARERPPQALVDAAGAMGCEVLAGCAVVATRGRPALTGVAVRDGQGRVRRLAADLLAVSGGWNPTVHLFNQSGGKIAWDEALAAFKPDISVQDEQSVGAAAGDMGLAHSLAAAHHAGERAATLAGFAPTPGFAPPTADAGSGDLGIAPLWRVDAPGQAFVDFQNDVSVGDIELAARENFRSVEHLKRYTTLGMAVDQGKTSNVNAMAIMGLLTGREPGQAGATRDRFPFTPVSFGALAGRRRGPLHRAARYLPAHARHEAAGAVFEEYGDWMRPAYYPRPGEGAHAAEQREALAVRRAAGLFDGSPLGKIEVKGPDAGEFLDRVYANSLSNLKVGRARYGLMLDESGVVIDDGVTARLADDHFLVGTTGVGAVRIAAWLDEWLQCEWPDLDVLVAPVTTAVAVATVSGPHARDILLAAGVDFPVGPKDFPHMTFREGCVAGAPARVFRVSFTGEVSYEINVPAGRAEVLWDRLMQVGAPLGLAPVGIDAWMLLRTEKGYLHVGADTDGTTSPDDIGWGHVLKRRHDFIGRRSLTQPHALEADRLQLVGLQPVHSADIPVGAHLRGVNAVQPSEGYVTSAGFSPTLKRWVALGMVRGGRARLGERLTLLTPKRAGEVVVCGLCAYDPQGARLNG